MAYNGSGIFNRLYNWVSDAAAGIDILASRMDAEMDGFATGLSNCVTRDGQSPFNANIPAGGYKITGLGNPTSAQDAATKIYVDNALNGAGLVMFSDTPPATPLNGTLWYKTVSPVGLYVYFEDVDTDQWIAIAGNR